jgi:hypothetical protein
MAKAPDGTSTDEPWYLENVPAPSGPNTKEKTVAPGSGANKLPLFTVKIEPLIM